MAHSVRTTAQDVFDLERVRIVLHVPDHTLVAHRYARMFPVPLPDTAKLEELHTRLNLCLGNILFGVCNPLGSPTKISGATPLANLRAHYGPRDRKTQVKIAGSRVLFSFRKMAAKVAA